MLDLEGLRHVSEEKYSSQVNWRSPQYPLGGCLYSIRHVGTLAADERDIEGLPREIKIRIVWSLVDHVDDRTVEQANLQVSTFWS